MASSPNSNRLDLIEARLCTIVQSVLERGYDDIEQDCDDYSLALSQFEFRKLVTFQLYEVYFSPKRHEFDVKLLTDVVEAVCQSGPTGFIGTAAVSGIVGNIAYELSKRLFGLIANQFQRDRVRSKPFKEIVANLTRIREYFDKQEHACIEELSDALDVDAERLEPLLKLLGFKCRRRNKRKVWIRPTKW